MAVIAYNQLLPQRGEVQADSLIAALELRSQAPATRPYTVANFSSTADGSATVQGRSGEIGDDGDRAMFHALRESVDAVMAGTGTLRAERYGRILGKEERRRRRQDAGLSAEPLTCTVSRSGRLPLEIPLFAEPGAQVVVFSAVPLRLERVAATVHVEPYEPDAERPLEQVMKRLREGYDVDSLLCEGGPSLFGSLLAEQLVDELFLTLAPSLTGGDTGLTVTAGKPLPELAALRIRWLLERNDSLYLRYALASA